jgi:hypothetical protein
MLSSYLSPDSPEVELSSDNSVDRTNKYNKATNDVKNKVDKILSNISINEAQEIIRISGIEVYAVAKKHLDSTFEFIQSSEYVI